MKINLLLLLGMVVFNQVRAQDVILLKKSAQKINCKVIKVGPAFVFYTLFPDTAKRKEHKIKIASITYANGDNEYYDNDEQVINDNDVDLTFKEDADNVEQNKSDIIIFKNRKKVYANVLEIKPQTIVFKRYSNPDGPLYEETKDRIIKIIYKNNTGEKFSNRNKTILLDSTEIRGNNFFTHYIKLNPVSVLLNTISLKYEWRIIQKLGLQFEAGYIHEWKTGMEDHKILFAIPGYNLSYKGLIARAGIRKYFSRDYKSRDRIIQLDFFYKHLSHDRLEYWSDDWNIQYENQRTRNVYGINMLFCRQKNIRHFLVELYLGVSLRYSTTHLVEYRGYGPIPNTPGGYGSVSYDPPMQSTIQQFLPAIQGGINIGFGFNGKKKTN